MNLWFRFWWYWLIIATCGVTIFGISLVILPDFMQLFFNAMFFSPLQAHTTFSNIAHSYIKFLYGVLGAVMVGWSVTLLFILVGPFHRGQREAWYAMTVSVLVWFMLDSSLSISTGFWQNAVFNTIFLVFFAIPLTATYMYFTK
ncbi:MAG: hypothetical protein KME40_21280 [Komarekiella atlantica HA4396-MV6]|jgi:uncharacterized membrane protein YhaH (DUF805 family)|nr:hypothetical protein [Komarekiella atlantica HA4396-MV6]